VFLILFEEGRAIRAVSGMKKCNRPIGHGFMDAENPSIY